MPTPKGRILCTEDDADTRELIVHILTNDGFEVVCSEDANDALSLARSQAFDLYLLDNWLPGLSGTELTNRLRKFDTKPPILFYSGAAYQSDKEGAILAGAQAYLIKPASPAELIKTVAGLIAELPISRPSG